MLPIKKEPYPEPVELSDNKAPEPTRVILLRHPPGMKGTRILQNLGATYSLDNTYKLPPIRCEQETHRINQPAQRSNPDAIVRVENGLTPKPREQPEPNIRRPRVEKTIHHTEDERRNMERQAAERKNRKIEEEATIEELKKENEELWACLENPDYHHPKDFETIQECTETNIKLIDDCVLLCGLVKECADGTISRKSLDTRFTEEMEKARNARKKRSNRFSQSGADNAKPSDPKPGFASGVPHNLYDRDSTYVHRNHRNMLKILELEEANNRLRFDLEVLTSQKDSQLIYNFREINNEILKTNLAYERKLKDYKAQIDVIPIFGNNGGPEPSSQKERDERNGGASTSGTSHRMRSRSPRRDHNSHRRRDYDHGNQQRGRRSGSSNGYGSERRRSRNRYDGRYRNEFDWNSMASTSNDY